MNKKYAFQDLKENMARAMGRDLGISTKVAIEIAKFLRGQTTEKAKAILNRVLKKKQAVPFTRFTDGVGHRAGTGLAAGRFPQKASQEFLKLIENVEANAQVKGLSTNLIIIHLLAHKGSNDFHYGRQRRRKYKKTHLEIVVEEQEQEKKAEKKETKKPAPPTKPAPKTETPKKTEEKKETVKAEEKKIEEKKPEPKVEEKKETTKEEQPSEKSSKAQDSSEASSEKSKVEEKKPKDNVPTADKQTDDNFDKLKEITKMSTK